MPIAQPIAQSKNDVSVEIHQGEVLCLLGDNGAGKSTLIKVCSGFHHPSSDLIRI
ncbi:MAG: ATP-binding cassette domain-containing protein [Anaerolineales bacterium]|nr:ATP-binding cassette domain-containing protein [Anaerolineales bacterium]